jgi:hypothetical protein
MGIQWVEGRDDAKQSTRHMTNPQKGIFQLEMSMLARYRDLDINL